MIAEAKQSYRGVICIHCHQPTPLTPSAESKEQKYKERLTKIQSLTESMMSAVSTMLG